MSTLPRNDRRPDLHKFLINGKALSGFAIDGGAAVHFIGGDYHKSLQFILNPMFLRFLQITAL